MDISRFRVMSAKNRALVALGLLMDGSNAAYVLSHDLSLGEHYQKVCEELNSLEAELRLPLLGTLLRQALLDLNTSKSIAGNK